MEILGLVRDSMARKQMPKKFFWLGFSLVNYYGYTQSQFLEARYVLSFPRQGSKEQWQWIGNPNSFPFDQS